MSSPSFHEQHNARACGAGRHHPEELRHTLAPNDIQHTPDEDERGSQQQQPRADARRPSHPMALTK